MKAKVYFSREITPEKVVDLYHALGVELPGKVAVKVHSGEKGNQNFLRPDFWKPMVEEIHGTITECNTAYGDATTGVRDNTESHLKLLEEHGWTRYFNVDLLDAEGPDVVWPIPNGKILKENHLGKNIVNYDSMLVLAHFKGHPMGGYGGALKQLSIGCAPGQGQGADPLCGQDRRPLQDLGAARKPGEFPEAMADAAIVWRSTSKGRSPYQCDEKSLRGLRLLCVAEDPCMKDIGILASLDPVAIDQACIDLVVNSDDPGREHFMERVNSRNGIHTIEAAADLGLVRGSMS